ncbi:MAG TPA: prolyl oligopeptidase family serine peptidase [Steroidobacteraceae bacterium]|nr:prolyl oligopeptidase family serine peptidase [Steroidobacteraceae bacterium]
MNESTAVKSLCRGGALLSLCLLASPVSVVAGVGPALRTVSVLEGRELAFAIRIDGGSRILVRVCRPATDAPAPLVVINHGSPPDAAARPRMQVGRCDQEAAQWFLRRGYVVAFPLRRGYGATGGEWAESYGGCHRADYFHAGLETARDIDAAVHALATLPFVQEDDAVIVGQSAGGWGTIAYDSIPHPHVSAFIVMAGGRGGHLHERPNENCQPERLAQAAGRYGATATTPMLWVYALNDTYFGPAIARALYQSFTAAGGKADFEQPERFGDDGHHLFFGRGGSAVWGPLVERYLAQLSLPSPVARMIGPKVKEGNRTEH